MTRAELRELLAASHKVSQRWVCGAPRRDGTCQVYAPNRGPLRVIVPIAETEPANGALIVAAVNHLGSLLDKLDAAEAALIELVDRLRVRRAWCPHASTVGGTTYRCGECGGCKDHDAIEQAALALAALRKETP